MEQTARKALREAEKLAKTRNKAELAAQRKSMAQKVEKRGNEEDEEESPQKKYSRKACGVSEELATSNLTTKLSSQGMRKEIGTAKVGVTEIGSDSESSSVRVVAKTDSRGRTIHLPQRYNV